MDAENGGFKLSTMGDIFTWCSTTSDAMAEWTSRFESAHFIGLKAPLKSKLIVVGRCRGRETEKCENRRCFPLYLNKQWLYGKFGGTIGFSTSNRSIYALKRKANDRWGMCYVVMGGGLKIGKIEKIGNGFACYGRTGSAMMKRTPRLDSAHQIGLSTSYFLILSILHTVCLNILLIYYIYLFLLSNIYIYIHS